MRKDRRQTPQINVQTRVSATRRHCEAEGVLHATRRFCVTQLPTSHDKLDASPRSSRSAASRSNALWLSWVRALRGPVVAASLAVIFFMHLRQQLSIKPASTLMVLCFCFVKTNCVLQVRPFNNRWQLNMVWHRLINIKTLGRLGLVLPFEQRRQREPRRFLICGTPVVIGCLRRETSAGARPYHQSGRDTDV